MNDARDSTRSKHVLRIVEVELVGGAREVSFRPGFNLIRGDITTGKTTLIRLLRAFLGSVPRHLPPETAVVRALRGRVALGGSEWDIYRPMTTTKEAPVEIAAVTRRADVPSEFDIRLPAAGAGGYGEFLMVQLGLPIVSVPRARREPTTELSPVTINDWLLYCVVTGDELDTQVFGHRDVFRDLKRRWVFEIAYGLYDEAAASLSARLRSVDLEMRASESEAEVIRQFLVGTTFGKPEELEEQLNDQRHELDLLTSQAQGLQASSEIEPAGEIALARGELLTLRTNLDDVRASMRAHRVQLRDLAELDKQLTSLSKRLTRSIVADEWLVDFDFVVCPRCGQSLDQHRTHDSICYLCSQPEPTNAPGREVLLQEQDRVTYQIAETRQLVEERTRSLTELRAREVALEVDLDTVSRRLDSLTSTFVSARASKLQSTAARIATLEANIQWIANYLSLVGRQENHASRLKALKNIKNQIEAEIETHETLVTAADDNIRALEIRMEEYLARLHVPQLGNLLTVKINRQTYLPEVSTRTFDELSSQGLKTLVNVAHALAHHTVAIDRGLSLPGLLILDGVSANSGKEGLERDRIVDMYELFADVAHEYGDVLQLIVVDNDLPAEIPESLLSSTVLMLSQDSRLIGNGLPV